MTRRQRRLGTSSARLIEGRATNKEVKQIVELKEYDVYNLPEITCVYIIKFLNGYYYIGQTYNLNKRIDEHINEIAEPRRKQTRWYNHARQAIEQMFLSFSDSPFINCVAAAIKVYAIETKTKEEVENIEAAILSTLYLMGYNGYAYNTHFEHQDEIDKISNVLRKNKPVYKKGFKKDSKSKQNKKEKRVKDINWDDLIQLNRKSINKCCRRNERK